MLSLPPIAIDTDHQRAGLGRSMLTGGAFCVVFSAIGVVEPPIAWVGLGLLTLGTVVWANAARCPRCKDRWNWRYLREHAFRGRRSWLRELESCPVCSYRPERRLDPSTLRLSAALSNVIELASKEARERDIEIVDSHLLLKLLGSESVATLLAAQNIAIGELKGALESAWEKAISETSPTLNAGGLSEQANMLVRHAASSCASADLDQVEPEHVLAQALREELAPTGLREILEMFGLSLYEVRRTIAHGPAIPNDPDPPSGIVDVVLYNDPFTTREFVIEALTDVFGLDPQRAIELVLEIHAEGVGIVPALDAGDAAIRLATLRERARAQAFPLRAVARERTR